MKIISLNLWFNSFLRFERSNLFIKYINITKPDIVLLQECTKETLAYIYQQLTNISIFIIKYFISVHFAIFRILCSK